MKPRTLSILIGVLAGMWMLLPVSHGDSVAGSPAPDSAASPAAGKGEGKKKKNREGGAPTPAPAATKGPKEIPFPLPINQPSSNIKIPDLDATGKLLSMLLAQKATRIDNEHVQMQEMRLDLNHPDGKADFHIIMPASVFNLQTHMITSEQPVTVRTQDFELTGEKMEFNTVERDGRLIGHVRMIIHNLKQVAGSQDPTP